LETIKVEMNVVISAEDWSYAPGNIVELDKPLADAWIECGHAKPIKGEKVDKTVLPDGVEYKGHGVFIVKGNQPAATKTDAIEALKVRVAAEKAAAKAKEATEDAENSNVSNDGADNANGSEESS
jgi:CO/xanthine dehydrogenase Mo-binding subunit